MFQLEHWAKLLNSLLAILGEQALILLWVAGPSTEKGA
jgi:hypothetical protein